LTHTIELQEKYKYRFSPREILAQIRLDLWSKGVQTGYSSTYAWLAGQFGHFALGFFVLVFIRSVVYPEDGTLWNRIAPGALMGVLIAVKEWRDYRNAVKDAATAARFPMDKADVAKDAATAVWFVVMGIFIGEEAIAPFPWGLTLSLILVVISIFIGRWWLSRKKCFQQSDVPVVYRLSNVQIDFENSSEEKKLVNAILEFVSMKGDWRHMLISGPLQSGKTTLACAIGAEHTFRLGPARYLTYLAFLQISNLKRDPTSTQNRPLWSLEESNIIILDDIDISGSGPEIEAKRLLDAIRAEDLGKSNERRTIWVLSDVNQFERWRYALSSLFSTPILLVQLRGPKNRPVQPAKVVAKGFM